MFLLLYRCTIKRPGKEADVVVTPDKILCEHVKEAEHLASTLALYTLCKGQVGGECSVRLQHTK